MALLQSRIAEARVALLSVAAAAISLTACAPAADTLRDNKAARAASASSASAGKLKARNPYSAKVLVDPYVLEQQRATLEALRRSCEQTKQHCELAEGASEYLADQNARR
nr:hypothetical protein [uncultured Sphingosinicella sp.]